MKTRYLIFLTAVIGIISEFVHPNIKTWVPVSLAAYIICGLLVALAIYFRKKDRKKFIATLVGSAIVFTEYAVITAVAFLRMADKIIADGPISIGASVIVAIMLAVIAFWDDVKRRILIKK